VKELFFNAEVRRGLRRGTQRFLVSGDWGFDNQQLTTNNQQLTTNNQQLTTNNKFMNRREFLMWVGVGGIASSLPMAIAACTPQEKKVESAKVAKRPDGFGSIGTVAELKQKGQIFNKESVGVPVLVVSTATDAKSVSAINPTCSHKGCTVDWKPDQKAFVCPCHKATFSSDGKVIKGPAEKPLPLYETKIEGDAVLVKVS
jgi:cytochrome b6-f complex iron-sulfur subunit